MQLVPVLFAHAGASVASWGAAHAGALAAARIGTSAVSALSGFALASSKASSLNAEAGEQQMQARQEFIQAQAQGNEILRSYNDTIGAQLAEATAMGIDISSGSVRAQGERAQGVADRQLATLRSDAILNASLRRARAASLRAAAKAQRVAGMVGALGDFGAGVLDVGMTGAKASA